MDKVNNSEEFFSLDLRSATDRLPIEIITQLLKSQLPSPYMDAWGDVMVGYPFYY